ncbi:MAG: zinc ribbon domain-containing protein [Candidatus Bathyarchaeota archaeon]|nr:zinc ribbon domain-containing protein [Candidatus Bathyarchaeota archaeon]
MSKSKKYCSECGEEVSEGTDFCTSCGARLLDEAVPVREGGERSYVEHLTVGFNIAVSQPMVFVPAVLSGVISWALTSATLGYVGVMAAVLSIIGSIIGFVLNFASIDMSRDAYQNKTLDLVESVNYVTGRAVEFFIASIVGGLMSVTIILIPAVLLMFVVMVVDETGIGDAVSKSIEVLQADIRDVLLILLVSIIGSFVIGFVPLFSGLLNSALNVVVGLAFIDIYINYKQR